MPHSPRFDPMPERANDAALELALRPFLERFTKEDKHGRAAGLLFPQPPPGPGHRPECRELLSLIDTRRGRTYAADELTPWHPVRGVFLVDRDAFALDAKTALGLYVKDPWIFVAYSATFAIVHWEVGQSLLFT